MNTPNPSHLTAPDYRVLFEENPLPMLIFSLDTLAFLAVNDAAVAHYGYAREEFLALSIKDIRPEKDIGKLLEFLTQAKPQVEKAGVWQHRKKNGDLIEVELTVKDLRFEEHHARIIIV